MPAAGSIALVTTMLTSMSAAIDRVIHEFGVTDPQGQEVTFRFRESDLAAPADAAERFCKHNGFRPLGACVEELMSAVGRTIPRAADNRTHRARQPEHPAAEQSEQSEQCEEHGAPRPAGVDAAAFAKCLGSPARPAPAGLPGWLIPSWGQFDGVLVRCHLRHLGFYVARDVYRLRMINK